MSASRTLVPTASLLIILGLLLGVSGLLALAGVLWPALEIGGTRAARFGLAAVFVFTGIGHFVKAREMAEMLPPWVPARLAIIWATGVLELAFAAGLVLPGASRATGIAVIAFLLAVFPANVSAARRRVDFGGHGRGPAYLLVRAPLQLLLIAWAYGFAVR
ncbi:MAG: DoxX family protein [Thermoanaerobaculia bacterium]